jgi:hypothetical protein
VKGKRNLTADGRSRLPQVQKSQKVRQWMADNQNKHKCECGCNRFIEILIHHSARGILKFINGHVSRVSNPMSGRCGSANPNYKAGKYTNQDGYVMILIPGPGRSRYIAEHIQVMQEHLGRDLLPDEVVHHINRIKDDNRIENLRLMNRDEHSLLHAQLGEVGFVYHRKTPKRRR